MSVDPKSPSARDESRAALEDIVHLTQKICGIWGSDDLDTFLSHLVMDARDGARKGLPVAVATEVLFLAQLNKMVRAIDLGQKISMSPEEALRRIDEADQARLRIDPLDDPSVSRDTIIVRAERSNHAAEHHAARARSGGQAQGLGELLMLLIRSKWLAWAIVLILGLKFLWPTIRAVI